MAVRKYKPTTPGQRHKIIGTLKMTKYLGSDGFVSIAKRSGYVLSLDGKENIIESSEMYIACLLYTSRCV